MIRVGGENVAAAEIESVLFKHHAVKQAVAVGMADPRLAEVVALFVEFKRPGSNDGGRTDRLLPPAVLPASKVRRRVENCARMADDRCRKDSVLYFERVSAPAHDAPSG